MRLLHIGLLFLIPLSGCARGPSATQQTSALPSSSVPMNVEQCAAAWDALPNLSRTGIDVPLGSLLDEWKRHEGQCKGTGIYEVRLASIYLAAGDTQEGRLVLQGISPAYEADAEALLAQMDLQDAKAGNIGLTAAAQKLDPRFAELQRRYGTSCSVKLANAGYQMFMRRFPEALALAEDAVKCMPEDSRAWQLAVYAAWKARAYDRLEPNCSGGVERNKALMGDAGFMLGCAAGYGYQGDFEAARDVLVIIQDKVPSVVGSRDYKEVQQYIAGQAEGRGSKWPLE